MGRIQRQISEEEGHRLLALASAVSSGNPRERNAAAACLNATLRSYNVDLVHVFRRGLMFMIDDPMGAGEAYPIFGLNKLECPVNTRIWKSAAKAVATDPEASEKDQAFAAWLSTKKVLTADQLSQLYQISHDLGRIRLERWEAADRLRKRGGAKPAPSPSEVN